MTQKATDVSLDLDLPDGSSVTVEYEGNAAEFSASSVIVSGLSVDFGLDVGHRDYAREIAFFPDVCPDFTITEHLSGSDGVSIWAGSGRVPEQQAGVVVHEQTTDGGWMQERFMCVGWEGRRHSLRSHIYIGDLSDLLSDVLSLRLEETDNGIVCQRASGIGFTNQWARVRIPHLGMFETAPLGSEELPPVPGHAGSPVRGGQLYRADLGGDGEMFLIANDSSVSRLLASHHHDDLTSDQSSDLEEFLSSVRVEWAAR